MNTSHQPIEIKEKNLTTSLTHSSKVIFLHVFPF